jgi:8-amino-7-oxononanoate synthase
LAAVAIASGPEGEALRGRLQANIARFRDGARARGLMLMPSDTPIQPLLVGADADALAMAAGLERRGYWVAAIRPPTVPEGSARLRITLNALHGDAEVDGLLAALDAARTEAA